MYFSQLQEKKSEKEKETVTINLFLILWTPTKKQLRDKNEINNIIWCKFFLKQNTNSDLKGLNIWMVRLITFWITRIAFSRKQLHLATQTQLNHALL